MFHMLLCVGILMLGGTNALDLVTPGYVLESNSNCSTCGRASVCCRIGDEFTCCPKIFTGDNMHVEIDEQNRVASYYYDNGCVMISDFRKGLLSRYDALTNECYLAAGIDYSLDDVIAAAEGNTSEDNRAHQEHYYNQMDAKPLEDITLLPFALRDKCAGKPIYWMTRVSNVKLPSTHERSKRGMSGAPEMCSCCCFNCCNGR